MDAIVSLRLMSYRAVSLLKSTLSAARHPANSHPLDVGIHSAINTDKHSQKL